MIETADQIQLRKEMASTRKGELGVRGCLDFYAYQRERARNDLLAFMKWNWWMPGPLLVGVHTRKIARRLTQAVNDFLDGKSTFLVVQVPFRHGKSDMVSRALPPYFLGRCKNLQPDVIMSGYGSSLVEGFSRKSKNIIRTETFRELFPDVQLSKSKNTQATWAIEGSAGEVNAVGLGGSITGKGGALITLDDYCKTRGEAESEPIRQRMWESFQNDLMTRRAPVSITVVCATPWHVDDVIGRIKKEMEDNENFPNFEFLTFPSESPSYPTGYLFPERFSPEWYQTQRATLGRYAASGLLDCDPQIRGGNIFNIDHIQVHERIEDFPDLGYIRFWDLASTEKERVKDDPDYTVGALVGVQKIGLVDHIWIKEITRFQAEAPARNERIVACAERDGSPVRVGIESVAGYKDAYTTIHKLLQGRRIVIKVMVSNDKVVRAAPLEAIFEAGNVHLFKAGWNKRLIEEFAGFPSTAHDDQVDAVAGAYALATKYNLQFFDRTEVGL